MSDHHETPLAPIELQPLEPRLMLSGFPIISETLDPHDTRETAMDLVPLVQPFSPGNDTLGVTVEAVMEAGKRDEWYRVEAPSPGVYGVYFTQGLEERFDAHVWQTQDKGDPSENGFIYKAYASSSPNIRYIWVRMDQTAQEDTPYTFTFHQTTPEVFDEARWNPAPWDSNLLYSIEDTSEMLEGDPVNAVESVTGYDLYNNARTIVSSSAGAFAGYTWNSERYFWYVTATELHPAEDGVILARTTEELVPQEHTTPETALDITPYLERYTDADGLDHIECTLPLSSFTFKEEVYLSINIEEGEVWRIRSCDGFFYKSVIGEGEHIIRAVKSSFNLHLVEQRDIREVENLGGGVYRAAIPTDTEGYVAFTFPESTFPFGLSGEYRTRPDKYELYQTEIDRINSDGERYEYFYDEDIHDTDCLTRSTAAQFTWRPLRGKDATLVGAVRSVDDASIKYIRVDIPFDATFKPFTRLELYDSHGQRIQYENYGNLEK